MLAKKAKQAIDNCVVFFIQKMIMTMRKILHQ